MRCEATHNAEAACEAFHVLLRGCTHGVTWCAATHDILFVSRPRHINVECSAVRLKITDLERINRKMQVAVAMATLRVEAVRLFTDEMLIELAGWSVVGVAKMLPLALPSPAWIQGFAFPRSGVTGGVPMRARVESQRIPRLRTLLSHCALGNLKWSGTRLAPEAKSAWQRANDKASSIISVP